MEKNAYNVNGAMDGRIVRMNAIKSTRLSGVSPEKKEAVKAAKVLISYIIENWDNIAMLSKAANDPEVKETQSELTGIMNSRIEELSRKDAVNFLTKNAHRYMDYQYGNVDEETRKKFSAATKNLEFGKTFDYIEEVDADEYKAEMEERGYYVIDLTPESDQFTFGLIKKA